jgi:hypothetical protein
MPKATIYLRVARQDGGNGRAPFKVHASTKPRHAPLPDGQGYDLPTVAFGVTIDIPEKAFKQAEHVIAELTLPDDAFEVAADVRIAEPQT